MAERFGELSGKMNLEDFVHTAEKSQTKLLLNT